MRRFVTIPILAVLLACTAEQSFAQAECTGQTATGVTLRQVNAIDQAGVDELMNAGTSVTHDQIVDALRNEFTDQCVRFTAVILTDPLNSGLANLSGGLPSRIHIYVRDTTANSQGPEGMGVQLVDGAYETTGTIDATIGDVLTVVGVAGPFVGSGGVSMQIEPVSITLVGDRESFGLSEEILDPVIVETSDINRSVEGEGKVQVNWENWSSLNGQFVRLENATVVARDISSSRPNWLISSDGGETVVNFYDMSIRYRNDKTDYPEQFNVQDDFVPPPPGSRINLQGTLVYQGDDPFNRGEPEQALISIAPWSDSDLEITETPPVITELSKPDFVPGTDPVDITVKVEPDPSRSLTRVEFNYIASTSSDTVTFSGTDAGDGTFSAQIPAVEDGAFVTYWVEAEDNTGAVSTFPAQSYRVLTGGIQEISHLQETTTGGAGDSPFSGLTLDMNVTATVQTNPGVSGMIILQDNADLAPWSGVHVRTFRRDEIVADLEAGDVINITSADISEFRGLTQLDNLTYTKTGTGDPLPHKVITTTAMQDVSVAEAHEGMMVRFEDVTVTSVNPDAPANNHGEWGLSSDGTVENQVRADDESAAISGFNSTVNVWEKYTFQQGVWTYTFNNYKLIPETIESDIGTVTNVGVEDGELPGAFALEQNYPNPFNPVTTIEYHVPASATVTLEVLDMLGRSVAVLVDGEQAAGSYSVRFDGQGLASGMYIYRLAAGSESTTRKMMLLK